MRFIVFIFTYFYLLLLTLICVCLFCFTVDMINSPFYNVEESKPKIKRPLSPIMSDDDNDD